MYTPFDLSGRGVVVTGGNGGIGFGMAKALLAAGARVSIWGSRPDKTERACAELAALATDARQVHALVCDVGDEAQVDQAFSASVAALGRVDACFANAGVSGKGTLMTDMSLDEFRRVQRINVEGVFLTFRAAARHMMEHGQGGALVATASTAALEGAARNSHYGASKGAVTSLVRALAVELARHAEQAGCDAVMSVPPMTAKLPPAALVEHFRAIADAISIPVIVQDASAYVGQAIPLAVYQQLLSLYSPEKILFKPEASPIGPNLSLLRDATRGKARIFEGSGGIHLLDSYRRGIEGTMPGLDLLDGIIALWQALQAGDEQRAYALYLPICASVALQLQAGLDGFLAIEKHLLVKRGLYRNARRRKPYGWELDPETSAEVDRLYDQLQALLHRN